MPVSVAGGRRAGLAGAVGGTVPGAGALGGTAPVFPVSPGRLVPGSAGALVEASGSGAVVGGVGAVVGGAVVVVEGGTVEDVVAHSVVVGVAPGASGGGHGSDVVAGCSGAARPDGSSAAVAGGPGRHVAHATPPLPQSA